MIIRWQSHIGKYLHRCDECKEEFDGRKNQRFCGSKCKAKRNNDIALERRNDEKGLTTGYLRNIEIVLAELDGVENEVITVSVDRLMALGFQPEAPNLRIFMGNETWYQIGPVAYRPLEQSNEVELFKNEEDESSNNN